MLFFPLERLFFNEGIEIFRESGGYDTLRNFPISSFELLLFALDVEATMVADTCF